MRSWLPGDGIGDKEQHKTHIHTPKSPEVKVRCCAKSWKVFKTDKSWSDIRLEVKTCRLPGAGKNSVIRCPFNIISSLVSSQSTHPHKSR